MPKASKTFRLSAQAIATLDALQATTGSTQAAILEQALTAYAAFLQHGRRPAVLRERDPSHPSPGTPPPTHTHAPHRADAYTVGDRTYRFPFPVAKIPKSGRDACPCGSGKRFSNCHPSEYHRALEAGLTTRD